MAKGELDVRLVVEIMAVLVLIFLVFLWVSHMVHKGTHVGTNTTSEASCDLVIAQACFDGEISSEELARNPECLEGVSCE